MKKPVTLLVAFLVTVITFAQNGINYKAVVKDGSGNLVTNQSIGVQFTVLEDAGISYVETHAATTDANGIVILNIGQGTATTSTFDAINWTKTTTLKTEIDIDGGLDNLVDMGTTEFKSVPYALTAGNSSFSTTANVTSNAPGAIDTDDFVFGSTELAHSAASNVKDYRMFFDKSKGALRAGSTENFGAFPTDGTAWDDTNVGENSLAAGFNTIASEFASSAFGFETSASAFAATAMGFLTTASGPGSTAMGDATTASGERSTAMGILTKAEAYGSTAIGINNVGGGDPSMYPPLPTSPMFEIGNGTYGTASNALTVLYDGLIIAPSLTTTMIANEATGKVLVTKEYIDAQAGAFSTTTNVTSNAPGDIDTDDFVFGSAQLAHSAPSMVKDYRMFFDQSKGAFRAGSTENNGSLDGSAWNEANIGENSFASGNSTEASGNSSTAMGVLTTASGTFSTAMGNNTIASGPSSTAMGKETVASGNISTALGEETSASAFASTAMGFLTTASGSGSTAMGILTKAEASASTAIGTYNVGGGNPTSFPPPDTNPIFEIGNGDSGAPSNALTVLYDGTITAPSFDLAEITDPKALVTKEYADGQASQLEAIDEGNGIGWRLRGRDPANYGPIGNGAVDLSFSQVSSSNKGATRLYSTAMGLDTTASNFTSTAMGDGTIASGQASTAIGFGTKAEGFASTSIGAFNVGGGNPTSYPPPDTNPIFEIGNGVFGAPSNALTVLYDGTTTINGKTIINEEATINGQTTINGQAIINEETTIHGQTTINEQTTINGATIVNDDTPDVNVRAISGIKTHIANVNDVAVYGQNTSTDGFGIGVQGNGGTRGVLGNASGVGSVTYVGVQGNSIANNSGLNIGVLGEASNFGSGGSAAVYAAGDLVYTGIVINASDRKLKTNISTISNSLEAISRLNPTTYSIKESYQKSMNMSSKPQFGFLAQELQEVFPDLVSNNVHPGTIEEAASIEYLGVNYIGLIPILTKGMQEQQEQIETLNEKVASQDQTIASLIARIEALENR